MLYNPTLRLLTHPQHSGAASCFESPVEQLGVQSLARSVRTGHRIADPAPRGLHLHAKKQVAKRSGGRSTQFVVNEDRQARLDRNLPIPSDKGMKGCRRPAFSFETQCVNSPSGCPGMLSERSTTYQTHKGLLKPPLRILDPGSLAVIDSLEIGMGSSG
ncbi:hypothetical protein EYF80_040991 [Liparis tanakae]|uniref:Uncharacterized protein n=1 Tax=Liparis tanakae TaxID=230148 RepID=A0A4Z2G5G2_9TELE|nr:hypothetical protein EYF80_040991 [Liparis tanakae]